MEGEKIIHKTNLHSRVYILPVIMLLAAAWYLYTTPDSWVGYVLFFFGMVILIKRSNTVANSVFVVTNKRIVKKTGSHKIKTVEIPLTSVGGIKLEQEFFDMFFNSGTLKIMASGGCRRI